MSLEINRRDLIQKITMTGCLALCSQAQGSAASILANLGSQKPDEFVPNLFLKISSHGPIELVCHRSEMGQGIRTGIPMLIAEELEVSLDHVKIQQALGDKKYGDQNTDGSRSIRTNYTRMRQMGATAREMLEQAAALHWKVSRAECFAKEGRIFHRGSKKSLSYQELATKAAQLKVPQDVKLKNPKDFKLIGKKVPAVDRKAFVTGSAVYGMDINLDGMVYAALQRSPTLDGKVENIDATESKKQAGFIAVLELNGQPQPLNTAASVAVIATNSWAAMEAAKKLKVSWKPGPYGKTSYQQYQKRLKEAGKEGFETHLAKGQKSRRKAMYNISKEFSAPFLVHAPMEPLVATASPTKRGGFEIWAPTQDPQRLRASAASVLGIDESKVKVNVTFLGGGFGRKSQPDFVIEAVLVAKRLNKPVKLVWSREDEIKHGLYHAASWQKISASLDKQGNILEWRHDTVFPTIMSVFQPGANSPQKFEVGMGASNMPYRASKILVRAGKIDSPLRVAWLRSVCNIFHAMAVNNFMDEAASQVKQDPIDFRLQALGKPRKIDYQDTGRMIQVIKRCRELALWNQRKKKGAALGFANHYSFQSYVAMVVEVEKRSDEILVKQIDVVADVGQIVHKEAVLSQFEGAAIFGLSSALYGNIDFKNGAVVQSNFDSYPVMRMNRSPRINVDFVESNLPPEGVGEPGTPPVAPAVIAAIKELTGKFITELPISKHFNV